MQLGLIDPTFPHIKTPLSIKKMTLVPDMNKFYINTFSLTFISFMEPRFAKSKIGRMRD